jgi:hypothetical protein
MRLFKNRSGSHRHNHTVDYGLAAGLVVAWAIGTALVIGLSH